MVGNGILFPNMRNDYWSFYCMIKEDKRMLCNTGLQLYLSTKSFSLCRFRSGKWKLNVSFLVNNYYIIASSK